MKRVWSFAKGSHCFSVSFLAFSLSSLMQPGDPAHHLVLAPPAPPGVTAPISQSTAPPPAAPAAPAASIAIQTTAQTPAPPAPQPQTAPQAPTPTTPAPATPAPEPLIPAVVTTPIESLLTLGFEEHGVPAAPFGDIIYEMAGRHAVNPYLVAALVQVESAFNPRAVSRKGARGLMQLLPATARRFGLSKKGDLFDPAKNLEAGIRYLKWLSDRFSGDAARVLAAYNAGEGAVDRFGGVPPYRETRNYVTRIFGLLGLVPALETLQPAPEPEDLTAAGR